MSGPVDQLPPAGAESHLDRVVFVVGPDAGTQADGEMDLLRLWSVIWHARLLITTVTVLFAMAGVAYALIADPWYRAEVVLMPVKNSTGAGLLAQFGQLSSLASLAGASISAGSDAAEPVAILKSRELARAFIEEQHLIPILFAGQTDLVAMIWPPDKDEQPDIRDAVKMFDEKVRRIQEDRTTGLVTLIIEWKDPDLAAQWANQLAASVEGPMRHRSIEQATENIAYLQGELATTNVVALQQAIGKLLESEMQKLMIARGHQEVAFRVVDPAQVPKRKVRPKRTLIVIFSAFVGAGLSVLLVLFRNMTGRRQAESL